MISVLYHNYNDKILQSSWLSAVLFLALNGQCTVIGQSSHSQVIGQYDKCSFFKFFTSSHKLSDDCNILCYNFYNSPLPKP